MWDPRGQGAAGTQHVIKKPDMLQDTSTKEQLAPCNAMQCNAMPAAAVSEGGQGEGARCLGPTWGAPSDTEAPLLLLLRDILLHLCWRARPLPKTLRPSCCTWACRPHSLISHAPHLHCCWLLAQGGAQHCSPSIIFWAASWSGQRTMLLSTSPRVKEDWSTSHSTLWTRLT